MLRITRLLSVPAAWLMLPAPRVAQLPDFFHRVEVRDITGHCNSVLFNPDQNLEYTQLARGSTLFVRYATKAYFSDLMTQVRDGQRWCGAPWGNGCSAWVCHACTACAPQ